MGRLLMFAAGPEVWKYEQSDWPPDGNQSFQADHQVEKDFASEHGGTLVAWLFKKSEVPLRDDAKLNVVIVSYYS